MNPAPPSEEALFSRYSYLVRVIARQLSNALSYDFDEAYSDGCIGLLKALRRYEPGGASFPCFAKYYIRGTILNGVRRLRPSARQSLRDGDRIREISIDEFTQAGDEHPRRLPSQLQVAPDVFREGFEDPRLDAAWSQLSPRHRLVLRLRFVHELEGCEIARVLRVDRSRVSQLVSEGIAQLRCMLVPVENDSPRRAA